MRDDKPPHWTDKVVVPVDYYEILMHSEFRCLGREARDVAMHENSEGTLQYTDKDGKHQEAYLLSSFDNGYTWFAWFPTRQQFGVVEVTYGEETHES